MPCIIVLTEQFTLQMDDMEEKVIVAMTFQSCKTAVKCLQTGLVFNLFVFVHVYMS